MTSQQNFRVNSFVSDKAIKAPCQAISVLDLVLYGTQTVNGVAVVAGDRVLVNAQTLAYENGIYNVEQTGWTRTGDWDGDRDATAGTIVIVAGDPLISLYQLDVTGTFTIGTSDAVFTLITTLDLAGRLASTANGEGASLVSIEDALSRYIGTTVEDALEELRGAGSLTVQTARRGATLPELLAGADGEPVVNVVALAIAENTHAINFQQWQSDTTFSNLHVPIQLWDDMDYAFEICFFLHSDTTPDFKFRFHAAAGPTLDENIHGMMEQSTVAGGIIRLQALNEALDDETILNTLTADPVNKVVLRGQIDCNTPGQIVLQGAQNTSDPTSTDITDGGYFKIGLRRR